MPNDINIYPVQNFIETVKHADMTQKRSITLDIKSAKTLAFTLGEMSAKINQDYESFINRMQNNNTDIVEIKLDGGGFK
jgi:hypothetical protein